MELADLQGTQFEFVNPKINTTLQKLRLHLCNGTRLHKLPNNVKRYFLGILPSHVSKAWQNAGPSLNEESVEKGQLVKQHLTLSMDHQKWYQPIQTS